MEGAWGGLSYEQREAAFLALGFDLLSAVELAHSQVSVSQVREQLRDLAARGCPEAVAREIAR